MATYDLTQSIPSSDILKTGDILNCPYSGAAISITLPKGTYKLECWGAQGGYYNSSYQNNKGGYSLGTLKISTSTLVYLNSGGSGSNSTASGQIAGGFNGGGYAYGQGTTSYVASSGGGGSDVRILQNSLYSRVIVSGAGGGGGSYSSTYSQGGYGGGTSGGDGTISYSTYGYGHGGTQTAGGSQGTSSSYDADGSFGQGANQTGSSGGWNGCAGGGGWYGGGSGGALGCGGGGGSGYVYTSSTASNYPSGSLLNSSYYLTSASTYAGNTSFTDYSGSTVTGHSGNGAVRITILEISPSINLQVNIDSTWKSASTIYINIGGTWKQASEIKSNIGGVWK